MPPSSRRSGPSNSSSVVSLQAPCLRVDATRVCVKTSSADGYWLNQAKLTPYATIRDKWQALCRTVPSPERGHCVGMLTSFTCASSFSTTGWGIDPYERAPVYFWPSVSAHLRNFTTASPLALSFWVLYTNSQVNEEIGYESAPGASVIETRKSAGMLAAAPAAAAVTPARLAVIQLPS